MLYIFVDIKIDSLHFVETVKANLDINERISLGRSLTISRNTVRYRTYVPRYVGNWLPCSCQSSRSGSRAIRDR